MSTPHPPLVSVIDGVDAEAVAAAVQGCAGVSALDSGRFGEVASYLPGDGGCRGGRPRSVGAGRGPLPVGGEGC